MIALPRVLLGYLRLHHYIRLLQPAEQRVKRLPHLNEQSIMCLVVISRLKIKQLACLAFVPSLSRQIIDTVFQINYAMQRECTKHTAVSSTAAGREARQR